MPYFMKMLKARKLLYLSTFTIASPKTLKTTSTHSIAFKEQFQGDFRYSAAFEENKTFYILRK